MKRSSFLKSLVALGAALCVNPLSLFSEKKDANFEYWKFKWHELDLKLPDWVRYVKLHRTGNTTIEKF